MEAVLIQLLSIKNAFDFAFKIEIKIEIEIECFLIGICKFLFVLLCYSYTLSITLDFPIIFPHFTAV